MVFYEIKLKSKGVAKSKAEKITFELLTSDEDPILFYRRYEDYGTDRSLFFTPISGKDIGVEGIKKILDKKVSNFEVQIYPDGIPKYITVTFKPENQEIKKVVYSILSHEDELFDLYTHSSDWVRLQPNVENIDEKYGHQYQHKNAIDIMDVIDDITRRKQIGYNSFSLTIGPIPPIPESKFYVTIKNPDHADLILKHLTRDNYYGIPIFDLIGPLQYNLKPNYSNIAKIIDEDPDRDLSDDYIIIRHTNAILEDNNPSLEGKVSCLMNFKIRKIPNGEWVIMNEDLDFLIGLIIGSQLFSKNLELIHNINIDEVVSKDFIFLDRKNIGYWGDYRFKFNEAKTIIDVDQRFNDEYRKIKSQGTKDLNQRIKYDIEDIRYQFIRYLSDEFMMGFLSALKFSGIQPKKWSEYILKIVDQYDRPISISVTL